MRRALNAVDVSLNRYRILNLFLKLLDEDCVDRKALMENLARWAMLARALHLSEHEPLDVIIALKVAVFEQKRLLLAKTEKHGNSNCVVDNRAIWVCAMIQGFWVS